MIKHTQSRAGQGALEYLLLIGGAVLVATIILVIAVGGIFPSTSGIINSNLNTFQHSVTLHAAGVGSGGGGGGSLCFGGAADGIINGSDECDGSQFGSATCATELGVGYTGSLSCNSNCQIVTSACVPPVLDTAPPSFAFSGVTDNADGTLTVDWAADDSATGNNNPVTYVSGLAREAGGNTTLATMVDLASFPSQPGISYLSPGSGVNTYTDAPALLTGETYYYKMLYCDSASSPNCAVSATDVQKKVRQSILFEAESLTNLATTATGLQVGAYPFGGQTVLFDQDSPACNNATSTNRASYTLTVNPAVSGTEPWNVWVLGDTGEAAAQGILVKISTSLSPATNVSNTGALAWYPVSSIITSVPQAGANAVTVRIPCGTNGIFTYLDKVLLTTDTTCVPTLGSGGTNCI